MKERALKRSERHPPDGGHYALVQITTTQCHPLPNYHHFTTPLHTASSIPPPSNLASEINLPFYTLHFLKNPRRQRSQFNYLVATDSLLLNRRLPLVGPRRPQCRVIATTISWYAQHPRPPPKPASQALILASSFSATLKTMPGSIAGVVADNRSFTANDRSLADIAPLF